MAHKISILWGQSHDDGDEAITYCFDTEAELCAFALGVEAASGWLDFEVVEEGFVWRSDAEDEEA